MNSNVNHRIIIYPCPEGGYVAEIPSLPGCLAQGETVEECLVELKAVAECWVQCATGDDHAVQDIRDFPACAIPVAVANEFGGGEKNVAEVEPRPGMSWMTPETFRRTRSQRKPLASYLERVMPENLPETADSGEPIGREAG